MKTRDTTVNKIANFVRHEITYSNFKCDQHVKESEVARKFNVSRVPVREAFRILQSEGYLKVIPNRGNFVKKLSHDYKNESTIVYNLLSPVVLKKAIPRYKSQTYKKAEEILDKVENCTDFNKLGYLLWDFAKVIYGPSKLEYMLCIIDEIYMHNIRVLNEIFATRQHKNYDVSDHRKFLELCRMEKTEEAIALWKNHVTRIAEIPLTNGLKSDAKSKTLK